MPKTEVFIADPYNKQHIKLFKQFEDENNLSLSVSNDLENISNNYNETEYRKLSQENNETNIFLFLISNDNISDFCKIKNEKDRKATTIIYPNLNKQNRKIIKASIIYSFDILNSEEIFTQVSKQDKYLIKNMENNNFESLGMDGDNIAYLKEKENIKEVVGTRIWK